VCVWLHGTWLAPALPHAALPDAALPHPGLASQAGELISRFEFGKKEVRSRQGVALPACGTEKSAIPRYNQSIELN
jgi:hypothetical protein